MTDASVAPVGVLGAGSWGTALAFLVARSGRDVVLWSAEPGHAERIATDRTNERYLPGLRLETKIRPTGSLSDLSALRAFVVAVPSHAFREVLQSLSGLLPQDASDIQICWGTKGVEPDSALLLSEVADEVLTANFSQAVVSGPSFAGEVARGLPSALTVAAESLSIADPIADWFRDGRTRVYTSADMRGVQLGGAIKNVMAIAAGISDGLGFGANARAALITRGLAEMARLGNALGGQSETFMGLTGLGDLILTCTDDQSRNRRIGLAIGRGDSLNAALGDIGQEAEGVKTARELYRKSQSLNVEMPISEQVYRVLYEELDPREAVNSLLAREPRAEHAS